MNNYSRYYPNYKKDNQSFDYENNLISDYQDSNLSMYEIARKYKIGRDKISYILNKNNIELRKHAAAVKLAFKEGRKKPSRANGSGTKNIFGARFNHWETNAKNRGIEYSITKEYVQSIFEKQNGKCAYTGIELSSPTSLKETKKEAGNPYNISLDRIDSSLGYKEGNVQLVCCWVNSSKGNMPDHLFKEVLDKVRNTQV